jgi:CMP-N-acetylneuraminic acid synthetase
MKNINDICIIIQARLGSTRIPNKMIKPFTNSTLVDILFDKLKKSSIIPRQNILFSAHEQELKDIAHKHNIQIYNRSLESANSEGPIQTIFEWYNKINYKYVILISACNPLLQIQTIDNFINAYINSTHDGAFAVFEKKTYYWDIHGNSLTDYKGSSTMNTKLIDPIYEAAHCLYASKLNIIENGYWLDTNIPPSPKLFIMNELEAFDIDYEWQFNVAEELYLKRFSLPL